MTILTSQEISRRLSERVNSLDVSSIERSIQSEITNFENIATTELGRISNEIQGGIQALTQPIDDILDKANTTVVRLTNEINGLPELTRRVNSSVSSAISQVTGEASLVNPIQLDEIITLGTPESLASTITTVTNRSLSEVSNIVQNISNIPAQILRENRLLQTVSTIALAAQNYKSILQGLASQVLIDFSEEITRNFRNELVQISGNLTELQQNQVFQFVTQGKLNDGLNVVVNSLNLPANYFEIVNNRPSSQWSPEIVAANARVNTAEEQFRTLNPNVSSYISSYNRNETVIGSNTRPPIAIGRNPTSSSYNPNSVGQDVAVDTSGNVWEFNPISSFEELESLFRNINRSGNLELCGAIIHWSGTFLNQNVGSDEIHRVHISERGFSGVGYHLIIRRDGTLQRGRPLNMSGAHDRNNNNHFLGFCFIGGLNVSSTEAREPHWQYASSDSFTQSQWNTYDNLMKTFHLVFPRLLVGGHYMSSNEGKVDPGFDVVEYSRNRYGHINSIQENSPLWKTQNGITPQVFRQSIGIS